MESNEQLDPHSSAPSPDKRSKKVYFQRLAVLSAGLLAVCGAIVFSQVASADKFGDKAGSTPQFKTSFSSQIGQTVPQTVADGNSPIQNPTIDNQDPSTEAQPPFAESVSDEIISEIFPGIPGFLHPSIDVAGSNHPIADVTSQTPDQTDFAVPETSNPPVTSAKPVTTKVTTTKVTTTKVTTTKATTVKTTTVLPTTSAPSVTTPNTEGQREEIVRIALSQVGVKEKKYNNVKYNTWYYGHPVCEKNANDTNYAWCVVFLSWCANQSGISTDIFPKTAGVSNMLNYYQNRGLYHTKKGYTPQVGDILFFHTSHVGIVVATTETTVTIVEGNYTDGVAMNTYKLSSSKVTGFASPNYS